MVNNFKLNGTKNKNKQIERIQNLSSLSKNSTIKSLNNLDEENISVISINETQNISEDLNDSDVISNRDFELSEFNDDEIYSTNDTNCADDEEDIIMEDNDENNENDLSDINLIIGFDFKSLLSSKATKEENGQITTVCSPLYPSLFNNVPPTIRFIKHNEKSKF